MKARQQEGGHVAFNCPGCGNVHAVVIKPGGWTWNGSLESPTFNPSVLVTSGHYAKAHLDSDPCWCTYRKEHPDVDPGFHCYRCHSFVRDGKIMFLADCSHALAGQTVDIPDWGE